MASRAEIIRDAQINSGMIPIEEGLRVDKLKRRPTKIDNIEEFLEVKDLLSEDGINNLLDNFEQIQDDIDNCEFFTFYFLDDKLEFTC